jgi:hypothetical protein
MSPTISDAIRFTSKDAFNGTSALKWYKTEFGLAIAYTALGEKEEALVLLEKDITERSSFVSLHCN